MDKRKKLPTARVHFHGRRSIFAIIGAVLLFVFSASLANAEIYKCTNEKNKTTYTDAPCRSGNIQSLTDIRAKLPVNRQTLPPYDAENLALKRQLDAAVKSAIAENNFIRAAALAATAEQKQWVVMAKKEMAQNSVMARTEAGSSADLANSYECQEAKRNLEREVNTFSPEPEVLSAKTSLMRVACGQKESVEIVYGNRVPVFFRLPHRHGFIKRPGDTSPPHDHSMVSPLGSKSNVPEDSR
ncbi:MAG: DUF4124 domain-containing protein [Methylophilaceae bacterium]